MQSFIRIIILTVAGLVPITLLQAQGTSPTSATDKSASGSSAKRTDVYHVPANLPNSSSFSKLQIPTALTLPILSSCVTRRETPGIMW